MTPSEIMDCNKDEAVRAKQIAERKFTKKDFVSAKKAALRARSLFPELDGISEFLTILDVYISAEKRICGEVDWYGILGVSSFADDETLKKQYRKLALALRPDKNKCQGADGAFKLVSEAWNLISDKAKRFAYDQRRISIGLQQKVPNNDGVPSAVPAANGFQSSINRVSLNRRNPNEVASSAAPSHQKTDTFWTICKRCKTHFEYLRIYLKHNLICPNCHKAFCALEKAPPPNVYKSSYPSARHPHDHLRYHSSNSNPYNSERLNFTGLSSLETNSCSDPYSKTVGFGSTNSSSTIAGQATNVVRQANSTVKRDREEGGAWNTHAYQKMGYYVPKEERVVKKKTDDNPTMGNGGDIVNQIAAGKERFSFGGVSRLKSGDFDPERAFYYSETSSRNYSIRELSLFELRNMLMKKARTEIRNNSNEWSSITNTNVVHGVKEGRKQNGGSVVTDKRRQKKSLIDSSASSISINVPDPDFHNFDLERNEKSFGVDQVWAAYDDKDGMPRYYARIHKVISLKPFRLQISWLNSRSNSEFGAMNWVSSGFLKTCGVFRTGRYEFTRRLNSFSHKVNWIKGERGVVQIFPRKGDIWALYRNWSPDWNEHTPNEVIHIYDMVEVLDDYNEEQGVSVCPLVKVSGFQTLFQNHMDHKEVRRIPKEEMFRFSHQVPSYLLSGEEAQNVPEGCRELDPAATPVEFLKVVTPTEENGGKE